MEVARPKERGCQWSQVVLTVEDSLGQVAGGDKVGSIMPVAIAANAR